MLWEGIGGRGQSSLIEHQLHARCVPRQPRSPTPSLQPDPLGCLRGASLSSQAARAAGGKGCAPTAQAPCPPTAHWLRPSEGRDTHPLCPRSVDTDESRYPQKLAFAECLCKGCISTRTGRETAALNSVPLHQSLLVLRRRPCAPDATGVPVPGAFTFHVEFIRVPVGCTCVLPRTAR